MQVSEAEVLNVWHENTKKGNVYRERDIDGRSIGKRGYITVNQGAGMELERGVL